MNTQCKTRLQKEGVKKETIRALVWEPPVAAFHFKGYNQQTRMPRMYKRNVLNVTSVAI